MQRASNETSPFLAVLFGRILTSFLRLFFWIFKLATFRTDRDEIHDDPDITVHKQLQMMIW